MILATIGIFAPQKLDCCKSGVPPSCKTWLSNIYQHTTVWNYKDKKKTKAISDKKKPVNDILETTKADEWEVINLTEKIKLKCEPIGREEGSL